MMVMMIWLLFLSHQRINSKYLADMASQSEGGDITMTFGGNMDPAIIEMSEVPEFLGVIMPRRF